MSGRWLGICLESLGTKSKEAGEVLRVGRLAPWETEEATATGSLCGGEWKGLGSSLHQTEGSFGAGATPWYLCALVLSTKPGPKNRIPAQASCLPPAHF